MNWIPAFARMTVTLTLHSNSIHSIYYIVHTTYLEERPSLFAKKQIKQNHRLHIQQ